MNFSFAATDGTNMKKVDAINRMTTAISEKVDRDKINLSRTYGKYYASIVYRLRFGKIKADELSEDDLDVLVELTCLLDV